MTMLLPMVGVIPLVWVDGEIFGKVMDGVITISSREVFCVIRMASMAVL